MQAEVVDLVVGGRPFTTTRATLCAVPDSALAAMFSGRWEGGLTRTATGAVFLDLDPDLFAMLLTHLRALQQSPPDVPLALPRAPAGKGAAWQAMLAYLGVGERKIEVSSELLTTFSAEHSHIDAAIGNRGKTVVASNINVHTAGDIPAVVSATVGMGGRYTWKIRLPSVSAHGLGIGFMGGETDGDTVPKWETDIADGGKIDWDDFWPNYCHVIPSGRVCRADRNDREFIEFKSEIDFKTCEPIVNLTLDTTHTPAYMHLSSHSDTQVALPEEWQRFRLCVVMCVESNHAAEIVSVSH